MSARQLTSFGVGDIRLQNPTYTSSDSWRTVILKPNTAAVTAKDEPMPQAAADAAADAAAAVRDVAAAVWRNASAAAPRHASGHASGHAAAAAHAAAHADEDQPAFATYAEPPKPGEEITATFCGT